MLVFICASCGRFGKQVAKEEDGEIVATCPYCGNDDLDWLSRPDLDDPKTNKDKAEGRLGTLETLVLDVMNHVYDAYDFSCLPGNSSATKTQSLEDFETTLRDFVARLK